MPVPTPNAHETVEPGRRETALVQPCQGVDKVAMGAVDGARKGGFTKAHRADRGLLNADEAGPQPPRRRESGVTTRRCCNVGALSPVDRRAPEMSSQPFASFSSSRLVAKTVFRPTEAFQALAEAQPDPIAVFFKYILVFALLPPIFAFGGGSMFGWRLGAREPLYLTTAELTLIGICYFFALLGGFVGTAVVARWMAATYGGRDAMGVHLALVGVIATPLVAGSICHLFPDVFINLLVLIPALIWSLFLLYKGLPIMLKTGPERGILMASALIAWLLVGAVSLLGLTVALWGGGIGPSIGV